VGFISEKVGTPSERKPNVQTISNNISRGGIYPCSTNLLKLLGELTTPPKCVYLNILSTNTHIKTPFFVDLIQLFDFDF
jgi:hypothetical protein